MDDETKPQLEADGPRIERAASGDASPTLATLSELVVADRKRAYNLGYLLGNAMGMNEGVLEGRRTTLQRLLRLKFDAVPRETLARIDAADAATLDRWEERILTATTLDDTLG